MAKVKNKKKAFKHRLKNKDFSIILKPLFTGATSSTTTSC